MRQFDIRFDVSHLTPFSEPQYVSAWLFADDSSPQAGHVDLLVCLPGATFTKCYYHSAFPGHRGYSFAERFVERNRCVLVLDHLGMGASTQPEPERLLNRPLVAAASHEAVRQTIEGLAQGRWFSGLGPGRRIRITGIGHSMGGMMLLTQQGRFQSFDRIAVLGWTNIGLSLGGEVEKLSATAAVPEGYLPSDRRAMRRYFHAEDVPPDVIAADDARATLTPASLGRDALRPGIVREEAAAITCPIFLTYGEIDVSPAPHDEVSFYQSAGDITLFLLKGSAHNHNFAGTRGNFWDRLEAWLASV